MNTLPLQPTFWKRLESSQRILLAGAGGGYDVFCGIPLYFALRKMGKEVFLGNLTFSSPDLSNAQEISPVLYAVTAKTQGRLPYFPELYLAQWLKTQGLDMPIFTFLRSGLYPVAASYEHLVNELKADTVILIDGGTDSLMRGDEHGLGTPHEDALSIAAVHSIQGVKNKLLVCLGFGVDDFHGVLHTYYLEAVAALTKTGGFLGAWSLTPDMPEVQLYKVASEYVHGIMRGRESIVSSSILDGIHGEFGDYHSTERTKGGQLFINPLMGLYWAFDLTQVAERNLYLHRLKNTMSFADVYRAIENYRESLEQTRPHVRMPL